MNSSIKTIIEKIFKCKIYRNSLPRGSDIFHDINRYYGIDNFRIIFDIGANVGQSAISYASVFSKAEIYCFEPVASTFKELERNTGKLGSKVHLYQTALGSRQGDEEISINSDSKENSILHNPSSTREAITLDTVDAFLDREEIDTIDFLKIDTEGYELEVLAGAKQALSKGRIGMLYIEAEPIPSQRCFTPFEELIDVLTNYGYKLFGVYEQQPHWTGEKDILFFNLVFVCEKLVEQGVSPNAYPLRN